MMVEKDQLFFNNNTNNNNNLDNNLTKGWGNLNFHKKINKVLKTFASNLNQNVILYGPHGAGKTTRTRLIVKEYTRQKNLNIKSKNIEFQNKINTQTRTISFFCIYSRYHIEINLGIYQPSTQVEIIRYYLRELSCTSNVFDNFKKIFVFHNFETVHQNTQYIFHRLIEEESQQNIFIFLTSNISKLSRPILSRCTAFRIPLPKVNEYPKKIYSGIPKSVFEKIYTEASGNIENVELMCQEYKLFGTYELEWKSIMAEIYTLIDKSRLGIEQLRKYCQLLFINCVDTNDIFTDISRHYSSQDSSNSSSSKIYGIVAEYQHMSVLGNKPLYHIEACLVEIHRLKCK